MTSDQEKGGIVELSSEATAESQDLGPDPDPAPSAVPPSEPALDEPAPRRDFRLGLGVSRSTVEFILVLFIGILFVRAFTAEAYIVPTGSMAPTLLGMHRDFTCPNCEKRFPLGMDDQGRIGRPVCPNCGQTAMDAASVSDGLGDRLLVQKFVYDVKPPKRWEVAVFQNPSEPSQAYVKRVVGLPGESVLISGGDLFINNRIARKTVAEAKAMAILVYDHEYLSRDILRYPRFILRRGDYRRTLETGWVAEGSRFRRSPTGKTSDRADWIEYRHWQPDRGTYGPICDFTPYNGADIPGDNRVKDLLFTSRVKAGPGIESVLARIDSGNDRFLITLPIDPSRPVEVRHNGRNLRVKELGPRFVASGLLPPAAKMLEVISVDRRLSVLLDGLPVFEPVDFEPKGMNAPPSQGPIALGVTGDGTAEISGLKIDRDVFYTEALSQTPTRPFGVDVPFQLGQGEYFVLGDNSPVSNDSRFWPNSPVVSIGRFLGKPFLVHLPSQAVPLKVFGRELYWIPDPREIRYIR